MSDIDFDELDKAVEDMMSGSGTGHDDMSEFVRSVKEDTPEAVPEKKVTAKSSVKPQPKKKVVNKAAPVKKAAAKVDIRHRGRFMDVMHPNHDMKASRSVPRNQNYSTTHSIEPLDKSLKLDDEAVEEIALDEVKVDKKVKNEKSETAKKRETKEDLKLDSVDDLDDFKIVDNTVISEEVEDEGEPDGNSFSLEDSITTPFLPDAKVEKRPLGGGAAVDSALDLSEESKMVSKGKNKKQAKAGGIDLSSMDIDSEPMPKSIYDIDDSQAGTVVVAPPKKKSGWIWLLVILLIALVGAGGGMALYFLLFNQQA